MEIVHLIATRESTKRDERYFASIFVTQVREHVRGGIISDPNNPDDEEYIVRLVGKVITVSREMMRLVNELAQAVTQEDCSSNPTDHTRSKHHPTLTVSDFRAY